MYQQFAEQNYHKIQQFHSLVYIREKWKYISRTLYMNVHSSIIHNSHKVKTTHMFIQWWMDKFSLPTQWYYSAIKGYKEQTHATTQMNPKNMLNERSLSQRTKSCMIPFTWNASEYANLQRQKVGWWMPKTGKMRKLGNDC